MEAHILHLLRGGDNSPQAATYKNNIQYSKKAYPLNKSLKQGRLHQRDKGTQLTKKEREPLIKNAYEVLSLQVKVDIEFLTS
jgi:hypothetical protein